MDKQIADKIKKKNGIYYTPAYICDYICKKSISAYFGYSNILDIMESLDRKNLSYDIFQKKLSAIKICDPSCGDGRFLVKIIEILFEIHKTCMLKVSKTKFLQYEEQKAILLQIIQSNIFGIDIDPDAVIASKNNISKKINDLLGTPEISPNLIRHLKQGNSLLDNWKDHFPETIKTGGFNIIIGNPPYIDIKEMESSQAKLLFHKFTTAKNRTNFYSAFLELGITRLIPNGGIIGFIIPNSLLYNSSYSKIRKLVLDTSEILEIIRLPDNVFPEAIVETIIIFLKKNEIRSKNTRIMIFSPTATLNEIDSQFSMKRFEMSQSYWNDTNNHRFLLLDKNTRSILDHIKENTLSLAFHSSSPCEISLGITPYDKYRGHNTEDIKNRVFHSHYKIDESWKPLLSGADITRYHIDWKNKQFIKYGDWLGAPRPQKFFQAPRIVVRQIVSGIPPRIWAAYTENEYYNTQIAFNIISKENDKTMLKYVLAILNSKLMSFYHQFHFLDETKTLFQKILIENAKQFPIKDCIQSQKKKIVQLVDEIQHSYNIPQIFNKISRQLDDQIYEIYSLQETEIEKIEDYYKKK